MPSSMQSLSQMHLLDLGNNQLNGAIPFALCTLFNLETLQLASNVFSGTIPPCLQLLINLEVLDISHNNLDGPVPIMFNNMNDLVHLDLSHNLLTGGIPAVFSTLTQLQTLHLDTNKFTGPVTNAFTQLHALQELRLSNNHLSGTIPSYLGSLSNLRELEMYYNGLEGLIPRSLGNLLQLERLILQYNQLTGNIPGTFVNLQSLEFIDLGYNQINSTIPTFWSALPNFAHLWLLDNYFTGTIPAELGNIANLQTLRIESNALRGTVPDTVRRLTKLNNVVLYRNFLTGTFPAAFCNMTGLQYIDMGDNAFAGTIPASLNKLLRLQYLFLDSNQFTGTIPSSVGEMSSMRELVLYNNQLTGSVPNSIAGLPQLGLFLISHNMLTGPISGIFNPVSQVYLNTIQINNNQFSGVFPKEIFLLPRLQAVVAGSNCFTSFDPAEICRASTLLTVSLDGLTSSASCALRIMPGVLRAYSSLGRSTTLLDPCLFNLPQLRTLHLSGAGLAGRLPKVTNITRGLVDLGLSHNALSGTIPVVYQHRSWASFDLSYNRLTGALDKEFTTAANISTGFGDPIVTEVKLSLDNNRLSGIIPESIIHLANVSVLGSNLFTCDSDRTNLPRSDDGADRYDCASDTFDEPYYIWLILVSALIVGISVTAYYFGGSVANMKSVLEWECVQKAQVWLRAASGDLPNHEHNERLKTLVLVSRICDALCLTAVYILAFILFVALPLYVYMSHYYGTMTHQYAYVVSMAFLSGKVPTSIEILILAALLLLVLCLFLKHAITLHQKEIAIRSDARVIKRNKSQQALTSNTASSSPVPVPSSTWKIWCNNTSLYTFYTMVNLMIVIGANAAYVYIVIYANSHLRVLAQISLAVFKIAWNSIGSASIVRWINSKIEINTVRLHGSAEETRMIMFQILVTLINNIAIPCLVGAVVSPSCFYYVIEPAPNVSSMYKYALCLLVVDDTCAGSIPVPTWTVYQPSFNYSYQCSSSIVQYYAPAFMAVCILSTFVVPVAQSLLCYWHQRAARSGLWFKFLDSILPNILQPIPDKSVDVDTIAFKGFFQANLLLILIVNYVGVLLTFGAVFPPLAVALTLALFSVVHFIKLKLGRFLCTAVEQNRLEYLDLIESECLRAGAVEVLRRSVWLLLLFSSVFFTLFVFDTLGDAVGFRKSFWVLVLLPALPFLLALSVRTVRYYKPELLEISGKAEKPVDGDVEMNDVANFSYGAGKSGTDEAAFEQQQNDDSEESTLNVMHIPRLAS